MTSILSTISVTFLGLIAALLGVAMLMEALPAYGRYLVFPFVLTGWLISLCLHEFGHAVVAYRSGDRSVVGNGYLTLDPLRYTDVQFSIFWPLVYLAIGGIGLPGGAVYLNKNMIRSPVDRSLVSAAGPLATLAVFILLLVILRATEGTISAPFYAGLAFLAFLQLTALVLNLLPVPGLDGWGIIEPWLSYDLQEFGARAAPIAPALLFVTFLLVPPANEMFWRLVYDLARTIGFDAGGAAWGMRLFQFWR
jgi:Zn-dependent protease